MAKLKRGLALATAFDIVNITRPLLSVNQMVAKGYNVVFGEEPSYIQEADSKTKYVPEA